jgi:hypothetical protein
VQVAVQLGWSASLWFEGFWSLFDQPSIIICHHWTNLGKLPPGGETVPLTYAVRFGGDLGIELRPHRYNTGYRADESKYGRHVHVHTEAELIPYLKRGWSVRMSAP